MIINHSDAWLLQSILHAEKDKQGAELTDILAYADYVNHEIITYEEFEEGLVKLIALKLVVERGNKLETVMKFKNWRDKKIASMRRIYVQKELEMIEEYLNECAAGIIGFAEEHKRELYISRVVFQRAVDNYLVNLN